MPHTDKLHLSVPRTVRRAARDDVVVHASSRTPTVFRGLRTTGADDTFLDLARSLGLVDLVILGDSLVRRRRTTPERLVRAAGAASGRGVALARRAAGLVRPGVDSPMETRCRLLRVLSGLLELETDVRFHDDFGVLTRGWMLVTGGPGPVSSTTDGTTSGARSSGRTTSAGGRSSRTRTGAS